MEQGRLLYKRDTKGKLRVWRMDRDGFHHRTVAGLADGKQAVSEWTVCVGKQGRSHEEQAAFEINSGYEHNLKREYFETEAEADGPARFFAPMLAKSFGKDVTWDKACQLILKERHTGRPLRERGIYSQPKLDGFRCVAQASGLTSREGQPIVSCPHIMTTLAQFFAEYPDAVLDGELYNHDLHDEFEELSSVLAQKKPTTEDIAKSAELVQFHVYDYASPDVRGLPFSERSELLGFDLGIFARGPIQLVKTVIVVSPADAEAVRESYLDAGYEGQILRLDLPYEIGKRSKHTLQDKVFNDGEFELVGCEEGKGNYRGFAKRATFKLPDGRTFGAGIHGGKTPFNAALLGDDHGQQVCTVQHFGWTAAGLPRMATTRRWHGAERVL